MSDVHRHARVHYAHILKAVSETSVICIIDSARICFSSKASSCPCSADNTETFFESRRFHF